jgi:tetratricopeptide (TPR) repeat protein
MQQQQAQEQFGKAIALTQKGKYAKAESIYRSILKTFPTLDPVLCNLGGVLYLQQKHDVALENLDAALNLNPTNLDAYVNRAAVLKALNRKEEAIEAYRQIAVLDHENGGAHYNYANVLLDSGDFVLAEKTFRKALSLAPHLHQAHHNLGFLYKNQNRMEEAVAEFQEAIRLNPDSAHYWVNSGIALANLGRLREAESAYDRAVSIDRDYILALQARARLLIDQGRSRAALEDLDHAEKVAPKNVDTQILLGNALDDLGDSKEAEDAYQKAINQAPDNVIAKRNLARIIRRHIPSWHFTMLADEARNEAYQKALEAAIRPGDTVLDIGTGSGLLSMMAARAGAKKVIACEMNTKLARTAREIVEDNGLDDKITILNRHSGELIMGEDLDEPVRVVVSEIVDAALIGEGVLPSLRHARRELSTDDAIMIPAGASVWVQLANMPDRRKVNPISKVSGFDLSRFDKFRESDTFSVVRLSSEKIEMLSKPVRIVDFDFANLPPAASDEEPVEIDVNFDVTTTGEAHGIVLWFDLHLNDDITVSTAIDGLLLHWGQAAGFFLEDMPVKKGTIATVRLLRTDTNWLLPGH